MSHPYLDPMSCHVSERPKAPLAGVESDLAQSGWSKAGIVQWQQILEDFQD